ncbi:shikimate kinase [Bdellovibrionota bacterium FG-2]
MKAAVIGTPVSHSLSPVIFSFLAKQVGMPDFHYTSQEVPPSQLTLTLSEVKADPQYVGLNVTLPHKQAILQHLDQLAPEVKCIGAANVVHCIEGRTIGYNTDVLGVIRTLEDHQCDVRGNSALIWGAGGASRAVAYALGKLGATTVNILNRDFDRARILCAQIGETFPHALFVPILAHDETPKITTPLSLLVNATSVGMKTDWIFPIDKFPLLPGALAFDLVYNPEKIPFYAMAKIKGLRAVDGLDMLIYQALATWEIWFGPLEQAQIPQERLRDFLLNGRQSRPFFLTGFMGVGKTRIGSILAKKLGWQFVDTDRLIQEEIGLSIPEIFETKGEAAFRDLEKRAIMKVAYCQKTIISLGGGALMDLDNLSLIERAGDLIYLSASVSTLLERLSPRASQRPLLAKADSPNESVREEKIRALLELREPVYNRARFKIETDHRDPEGIAEAILKRVAKGPRGKS